MPSDNREFKYESLQEPKAIARYLRAVADGLAQGSLEMSVDGRAIMLEPRGLLRMRLEARHSGDRARIELKVSWRDEQGAQAEAGPLVVKPAS